MYESAGGGPLEIMTGILGCMLGAWLMIDDRDKPLDSDSDAWLSSLVPSCS